MELKTYHSNIQDVIIELIQNANDSIKIAIAYFTNSAIMLELQKKLRKNCKIELIILNDQLNFRKNNIDFQSFISNGGMLFISLEKPTIHHKFCITDDKNVLTGSYNWTYKAENFNLENVVFIKEDYAHAKDFNISFERAKSTCELIQNLFNFHMLYPPVRDNGNEYILNDLEGQI